jgi:hypothetical protein
MCLILNIAEEVSSKPPPLTKPTDTCNHSTSTTNKTKDGDLLNTTPLTYPDPWTTNQYQGTWDICKPQPEGRGNGKVENTKQTQQIQDHHQEDNKVTPASNMAKWGTMHETALEDKQKPTLLTSNLKTTNTTPQQ